MDYKALLVFLKQPEKDSNEIFNYAVDCAYEIRKIKDQIPQLEATFYKNILNYKDDGASMTEAEARVKANDISFVLRKQYESEVTWLYKIIDILLSLVK